MSCVEVFARVAMGIGWRERDRRSVVSMGTGRCSALGYVAANHRSSIGSAWAPSRACRRSADDTWRTKRHVADDTTCGGRHDTWRTTRHVAGRHAAGIGPWAREVGQLLTHGTTRMIARRSEGVPARTERAEAGPRRVLRIVVRRPVRLEGTLIARISTLSGIYQYPYYHFIERRERTVGSSASKHAPSCAQTEAPLTHCIHSTQRAARRERLQWSQPAVA